MGADDQADAAVDEMADRLLLARCLGMEVDDDGVDLLAERTGGKLALDAGEGIVERVHEDAPHRVHDEDAGAVPRHEDAGAAPRRAGGIVERTEEAVLPLGEDQRLALVEDVVAGGHHVGAGVDDPAKDLLGDAEAAGGVLAVDGDEIDAMVGDQRRAAAR